MIVGLLPPHAAYVETCCGGASVFWAKPREASSAEILNDRDGELINFYQELHRRGRRLAREVDAMPYSRLLFNRVLASRPRGPFARAARFWYVNRVAFGAKQRGQSYGVQAGRRAFVLAESALAGLDMVIGRLQGVAFEALDVERLIRLYDRADTLFYCDPPYWGPSQPYACLFGDEDHRRLAAGLRAIRGAFLLSYNDSPDVRRLYAGMPAAELDVRYTIGSNSSGGSRSDACELLISNRPLAGGRPLDG